MFYVLEPNIYTDDVIYGVISGSGKPIWTTTRCSTCNRMTSKNQINNLAVELYGKKFKDYIWTDDDVIVTPSFANNLRASGLKGFNLKMVDIVAWWHQDRDTGGIIDWSQFEFPKPLYQFIVTGHGGSIMSTNSVQVMDTCSNCGTGNYKLLKNGINIDLNQWDGSDVFRVKEFSGYIFVSENFINFLSENNIQNYSIKPAKDFSIED
jgi:hypothetical protein